MNWVEIVPGYVTAVAVLVGGVWTYIRFFHERSDEPATDIDVNARFVGVQDGQCLVEVEATLVNRSLVRHYYHDFRMNMRYLTPDDRIVDGGDRLAYQVHFPHSIDKRVGDVRYFPNAKYINPRQTFHQRYETFVPAEATFIRVHCGFTFDETTLVLRVRRFFGRDQGPKATKNSGTRGEIKIDSQRVFAVRCVPTGSPGTARVRPSGGKLHTP